MSILIYSSYLYHTKGTHDIALSFAKTDRILPLKSRILNMADILSDFPPISVKSVTAHVKHRHRMFNQKGQGWVNNCNSIFCKTTEYF